MHLGRPTTQDERFSLKAAFRVLLKMAGGQQSAELITRGKHQTLNRYGNVADENVDCHAPIDVIADLERDVGEPVVTKHLAEMNGYMLVKKTAVAADANLVTHLSTLASESGQTIQAIAEGIADEDLTEAELLRIVKESRELAQAASAAELAAQAKLDALRKNVAPIRGKVA